MNKMEALNQNIESNMTALYKNMNKKLEQC